jgi:putative transposase
LGYEPEKHHRRSIRLKGYDYSLPGAYFVTLLCYRRRRLFGEINAGIIKHSEIGKAIHDCWLNVSEHFNFVTLDEFIIMPNHLHGIIFIKESGGKGEAFDSDLDVLTSTNALRLRQVGTQPGSLNAIIQNFKSVSTRLLNKQFFEPENRIWQRDYYERIIRNERELNAIRQYVRDNSLNWEVDKEYPGKTDRQG